MKKMVVYNGGTMSYYECTDPYQLVVGKMYEVVNQEVRPWQTDYTLKGVSGNFNSVWFNEVPVYFAIADTVPVVGKSCICKKFIERGTANADLIGWCTSTVQSIELISNSTYKVTTLDSIYIVTVK